MPGLVNAGHYPEVTGLFETKVSQVRAPNLTMRESQFETSRVAQSRASRTTNREHIVGTR